VNNNNNNSRGVTDVESFGIMIFGLQVPEPQKLMDLDPYVFDKKKKEC